MDVNARYRKAYIVLGIFFFLYIFFFSIILFYYHKFSLGLIFPFDWVIFIVLLIIALKSRKKYNKFNVQYPNCIEVFDYSNSSYYGKNVLMEIKGRDIILYYLKPDRKDVIPIKSLKNKQIKKFGLLQGGNPGFMKLIFDWNGRNYIFSIKKKDLEKLNF